MSQLAQRTSVIRGILWHQGESDCADDRYPLYEEKCSRILQSLRKDLGLENTPLLLGGLGDFLTTYAEVTDSPALYNYPKVNSALQSMARNLPNTGFVSAEGLGANPDHLHFNARSLREFGLRYYAEFRKLQQEENEIKENADALKLSEMEKL